MRITLLMALCILSSQSILAGTGEAPDAAPAGLAIAAAMPARAGAGGPEPEIDIPAAGTGASISTGAMPLVGEVTLSGDDYLNIVRTRSVAAFRDVTKLLLPDFAAAIALFGSAQDGNVESLRYLKQSPATLWMRDPTFFSYSLGTDEDIALGKAIKFGKTEAALFLLREFYEPGFFLHLGNTLEHASNYNQPAIVRFLLNEETLRGRFSVTGHIQPAMVIAASKGYLGCLTCFFEAPPHRQPTAEHIAAALVAGEFPALLNSLKKGSRLLGARQEVEAPPAATAARSEPINLNPLIPSQTQLLFNPHYWAARTSGQSYDAYARQAVTRKLITRILGSTNPAVSALLTYATRSSKHPSQEQMMQSTHEAFEDYLYQAIPDPTKRKEEMGPPLGFYA